MSNSLLIQNVDLDEVCAEITARVVKAIEPMLSDSLKRPKSRDEMAEWLGIGVATLDRMTREGKTPSFLLNRRRVYIPELTIEALTRNKGEKLS
ncbi:hypothetical protein [Novipirellula rosea]|uniref:hypothetical protein n=1 Tax=Novipirellula rosea TaxID=1031540 RepID=UPI0031E67DC3